MQNFEVISKQEFEKVVAKEFTAKNGVIDYLPYEKIDTPKRATRESAGYDFFSPISFKLKPGQSIKVSSCIKCRLNHGNVLFLLPRSSYGFNYRLQLDNTVGVVDSDYYNNEKNEGHIFIKVTNDSKTNKVLEVKAGEAFAQGIIMQYCITDDDEAIGVRKGGIGSTSNDN